MKCSCSLCNKEYCNNCVKKYNNNHILCSNCNGVMCLDKENVIKCSMCVNKYHKQCEKWEKIPKDGVTHFITGCNECREARKIYINS